MNSYMTAGMVAFGMAAVLSGCVSTTPPASNPAPSAAAESASAPETAEPESFTNTLRWTTATEVDNFGFDIYRATSEDGPFERITEQLIAGAGTTDEPQSYVWVDDTIDPTKGYYYYIESISIDSVRERFSPVISIGPKKPSAD